MENPLEESSAGREPSQVQEARSHQPDRLEMECDPPITQVVPRAHDVTPDRPKYDCGDGRLHGRDCPAFPARSSHVAISESTSRQSGRYAQTSAGTSNPCPGTSR